MDTEERKPEQTEDASWLEQYYTPEKTASPHTETLVSTGAPTPSTDADKFGLTSLPSGKYQDSGTIGSGGMKVVRRVLDKDSTRTVAMATIRAGLESKEMVARFIREARITAILEHPNIVPVHDMGVDATGRPYFTMKLLDGESLQEILKKVEARVPQYVSRYNLGVLLEIFKKVCNAIAFAHSRGVVHLDLKPSNIQVNRFGEVLVLDWGLAKFIGDADEPHVAGMATVVSGELADLTMPGAVKGTIGFMAPEQARGDNCKKDRRTDIYALGAILYALLTLKSPASADTVEKALAETVGGNLVPPRERTPGRSIPVAVEAVAMKALSLDPDRRYQLVEELNRDVDAFLGGFPTSAQDVNILTLLWLLVKRHKIRVSLSVLILTVIAGITVASMVRIRASERAAIDALNKYRAEQEENRRLGIVAAPQVLRTAEKQLRELRFEEAMRSLDLAVTLDSSLTNAWVTKGFLQLARQDFAGAVESFRRNPVSQKTAPDRRKEAMVNGAQHRVKGDRKATEPESFAEKYLSMAEGGKRPLSGQEFVEFAGNLAQLAGRSVPEARLALTLHASSLWNQAHGADRDAQEIGRELVKALNPRVDNLIFELSETNDGVSLTLRGGRGLSNISSLAGLRLVWLDLSGTGVSDLGALHGMPLAYLDISGTPARDLSPLADAPLKELRVEGCKGMDFGQITRLAHLERIVLSRDMVEPKQEVLLRKNAYLEIIYR